MKREWYIIVDGYQMGPFYSDNVQRMINEGKIKISDMLWCQDMAHWQTLGDLAKFADKQKQIANHKHQISNKSQITNSRFQTNNQASQEIFALSTKSIALATTSVFVLGLTLSTYWFSSKVDALNRDLYEAKETIAACKSELNKVGLRADESNALFNHMKSVVADTNEQLTSFRTQFAYQVNELKDAVNTDTKGELAQKDAISDIQEKVNSVGEKQRTIGINFKDIECAIQKLAEKVLDIKITVNEIASATANKQDVAAGQQKKQDGLTAEEYFTNGNKKYANGDYKSAIEDYSNAIALNPSYAAAFKKSEEVNDQQEDFVSTKVEPDLKSKIYTFIEKVKYKFRGLVK